MSNKTKTNLGSVVSLLRYPVKSMMGEELNATDVTQRGLLGDRAYALVDCSDGKVASAKNPRKWPNLFDFRATFIEPPRTNAKLPPVRITLPDGTIVTSEQRDLNQILSKALNREVTLDTTELPNPGTSNAEEYWPDIEELDYRDTVTDFALPEGTFFDCSVVHLLTTATLDRLRGLYPQGRFEVRRFRPNIVVESSSGEKDFIENDWIGHMLVIGDEVRLSITGPCSRCVMTTLPQGDLPRDLSILRTAAKQNKANVGVYAAILQGGTIRRGDPVRIE
jgi:MOSC domain-containing protein